MESGGMASAERLRRLMMKALDDELSPGEATELERALAADPALKREWDRLTRLKEVTSAMMLRPAPDDVWRDYWTSVYRRLERGLGWILLSVGAIVVGTYWIWIGIISLVSDSSIPWLVKAGTLALGTGVVILLVSVIREKVFLGIRQRYKDVER